MKTPILHFRCPVAAMPALFLLSAVALCGAKARAQNAPVFGQEETPSVAPLLVPNVPDSELQTASIQLRNVKPSLMAYWLDPARQAMPQMLRSSLRNDGEWTRHLDQLPRQAGNANGPRDLKLPDGIASLTPVDPQNVLRARGTAAGLDALQKEVARADVALQQVEIDAQFLDVEIAALAALPLVFQSVDPSKNFFSANLRETAFAFNAPLNPLQSDLNTLIAGGRAKLITAPRLTAFDGLVAALVSSQEMPFVTGKFLQLQGKNTNNGEPTEEEIRAPWDMGLVFVHEDIGFKTAPVLHGNLVALAFETRLQGRITQASVFVRGGQSVVVRLPNGNSDSQRARLVVITPRIIKSAEAPR